MPSQSACAISSRLAGSCGRPVNSRNPNAIATGTLMKKHHCQLQFSVSQPPATGPSSGPSSTINPKMVIPIGIWWGGSRVRTMVCAVGISAPPKKPWPTRPMIMNIRLWLKPHITEKTVNSDEHPSSSERMPRTRLSHALKGIITTSLTR